MCPDIIENGTLTFDNEKNYHNDNSNVKYAYIEGRTILNGKPDTIFITVRKSLQKNKFRVHNIYANEKTLPICLLEKVSLKQTI